jgi:hypothetical protein
MKEVTDTVILTMDSMRRNDLKYHQLKHFLEEVLSKFDIFYYSTLRWLGRGVVLSKLFYLHTELNIFMTEKEYNCTITTMAVAFVVHRTLYLSELNTAFYEEGKVPRYVFSGVEANERNPTCCRNIRTKTLLPLSVLYNFFDSSAQPCDWQGLIYGMRQRTFFLIREFQSEFHSVSETFKGENVNPNPPKFLSHWHWSGSSADTNWYEVRNNDSFEKSKVSWKPA